ncbi:MAG: methylmalonyl-CoA epimerase [Flavobacteriales bacterium]|nr:methylmalonyl-CoA epimerase [Flavobacteriales bacterium]
MEHIEHLGIAVESLERSIPIYEQLLNTKCYKQEAVESENVVTAFFQTGNNKIELLEATSPESAIAKFVAKRGEGIHHVAYAVNDIHQEMARLKAEGFRLLNEQPKRGADNKLICFVHPKDTSGVLMELCQEISE